MSNLEEISIPIVHLKRLWMIEFLAQKVVNATHWTDRNAAIERLTEIMKS